MVEHSPSPTLHKHHLDSLVSLQLNQILVNLKLD